MFAIIEEVSMARYVDGFVLPIDFDAANEQRFEIDAVFGAVGDCRQMNEPVGRAADRLQHHLCVLE